jgi:SAM-dependent methyltransferase
MKPDYGIDAPGAMRGLLLRGALFTVAGVIARSVGYPGLGLAFFWAGAFQFIPGLVMLWSSKSGKLKLRDKLLDTIPWRGDEEVLDVGCGRGLAAIGAAKRVPRGHVNAIDIWSEQDLTGNTEQAARDNVDAEGVADRVSIHTADARALPFDDGSFDVVVSMTAVHNIEAEGGRKEAISEMIRVLKPGGYLGLYDIFHPKEYVEILRTLPVEDIKQSGLILLWAVPGRRITARKRKKIG